MKNTVRKIPESIRYQEGKTSGVAYDTAWAARVTDESGKPLFPECVQWLLENQKPDGSWGSQIQNYHDRLLSTLSAVITLKEIDGKRYGRYIQKGETYIWENLKKLELDNCKLVASELLFPSFMEQAEFLGLNVPYHVKVYESEHHIKLEKIKESLWYSQTKEAEKWMIIVDLDGTIIDSEATNFKVLNQVLKEFGYDKHRTTIMRGIAEGKTAEEIMEMIDMNLETRKSLQGTNCKARTGQKADEFLEINPRKELVTTFTKESLFKETLAGHAPCLHSGGESYAPFF